MENKTMPTQMPKQQDFSADEASMIRAEFSALRDEILKRSELQHQFVSFALIAAGTFLTVGLQANAPVLVLLLYPALAVFLAAGWAQHDFRKGQIGAYIRDSLEKRVVGLGWESHLSHIRKKGEGSPFLLMGPFSLFSARGVFLGTQLLTLVVALFKLTFSVEEVVLLVIDGLAVIATIVFLRRWRG
jgi:hypothetical protein